MGGVRVCVYPSKRIHVAAVGRFWCLMESKIQNSGETTKRMDRLSPSVGTRLWIHLGMDIGYKQLSLDSPGSILWILGVHKFESLGNCQTDRPFGTKFGVPVRINLGMDIELTYCPSRPQ